MSPPLPAWLRGPKVAVGGSRLACCPHVWGRVSDNGLLRQLGDWRQKLKSRGSVTTFQKLDNFAPLCDRDLEELL